MRFTDDADSNIYKCIQLLKNENGDIPVYFFFSDTKKYRDTVYKTHSQSKTVELLKNLLGDENAVLQ